MRFGVAFSSAWLRGVRQAVRQTASSHGPDQGRGSECTGCAVARPVYGGGTPPDGILITIQTIMSQAFRMAARSNVSTAAAIRLALVVDCASNSAAAISASRYPKSGSRK